MEANIQNYVIMNWKFINHPLGSGVEASIGIPPKKGWVATAVSGALGLASSIFGGAAARRAAKEALKEQRAEKARIEGERIRAKNQSWMDTASGQNTMRILQDQARKFVRRQQGAAAVAGGTDAAVALEKELQNEKQAEVIANAQAHHEDRKELVDASYRQDLARVNSNIQQSKMEEAEADAQIASGVSDALMTAGQAMDEAGVFKKGSPSTPRFTTKPAGTGSPAGGGVVPTNGLKLLDNAIQVQNQKPGLLDDKAMQAVKNQIQKSLMSNSNYSTLLGNAYKNWKTRT